jgi:hypothetical protein
MNETVKLWVSSTRYARKPGEMSETVEFWVS